MNLSQLNYGRGVTVSLVAVISACSLWIGYEAGWGESGPPAAEHAIPQDTALDEIRLTPSYALLRPGQDLAETTARPLFNASRRPLPGEAQAGSARSSALPLGRYTLTGVSISHDRRVALLRDGTTNKTMRVEQNTEMSGVLIESVTPTKVTLKLGAEREEIPLKIAPAPKLAVATSPKPDETAAPAGASAGAPPSTMPPLRPVSAPPAAAATPGAPQTAADIANADPITDADVAERAARIQAKRSRQSAAGENPPR
jgi:hypothetical protein